MSPVLDELGTTNSSFIPNKQDLVKGFCALTIIYLFIFLLFLFSFHLEA